MLLDRVSNPVPLTYKSGALLIALCGPAYYKLLSESLLQNAKLRAQFDGLCNEKGTPSPNVLVTLASQLCHFYRNSEDGSRLVSSIEMRVTEVNPYSTKQNCSR